MAVNAAIICNEVVMEIILIIYSDSTDLSHSIHVTQLKDAFYGYKCARKITIHHFVVCSLYQARYK